MERIEAYTWVKAECEGAKDEIIENCFQFFVLANETKKIGEGAFLSRIVFNSILFML